MKQTVAILAVLGTLFCNAMTHNLAWPWNDGMSPPQTPYLAFSSPQSDTLMFTGGDELQFNCQAGLRSVGLTWSLHANGVNKAYRTGVAEGGLANRFLIRIPTKSLPPGFYDIKVELDTGMTNVISRNRLEARPVKGIFTFGWKADEMAIPESRPADFKAFWETARRKMDAIAPDAKLGEVTVFDTAAIERYNPESACLPPSYDPQGIVFDTVEACKINLAGPDGGRVYGWLAKPPSAPGRKFPAMLVLPGAGNAKRSCPLEHARHGFIALDIQVHGFDVDLDKYPPLKREEPKTPEEYSYYNIHLRCLQALNYLYSRPDVDTSRIVVCGGSQGGRLSTMMAGWDPRIAAAVPSIAHFANQPHLNWTKFCNGKKLDGISENPAYVLNAQDKVIAYYDVMNFARDITCPVFYNMGLVDPVSPPFGIVAIFNNIPVKTDKTLTPLPGSAHDWCAEFDRQAWRWLEKHDLCYHPVQDWILGDFKRPDGVNPVIRPNPDAVFDCPMRKEKVRWEQLHAFNPAAAVKDGNVYLLYRAEDASGRMSIGGHTSRLGLAISADGVTFVKQPEPVVFPAEDTAKSYEWDGGCEDPRLVEGPDGTYVLTYTMYNRKSPPQLGIATTRDFKTWTKHGSAFGDKWLKQRSKSAGILTQVTDGRVKAAKVNGKYWMYWGEYVTYVATSDDLIHWTPLVGTDGKLVKVLDVRKGKFDADLTEVGPPPLLTEKGIVMLFNGKNDRSGEYAVGQVLFDAKDPTRLLDRTDKPVFQPQADFERSGQYQSGTTFAEGLVLFKGKWFLYYGCADSLVGVAVSDK